jgi:hypothetical protein
MSEPTPISEVLPGVMATIRQRMQQRQNHERTKNMQTMTQGHQQWNEFYTHLSEMVDLASCDHTMNDVEIALGEAFGFTPEEVAASIEWFKGHGAECGCAILARFGPKVMEDLARLKAEMARLKEQLLSITSRLLRQENGYLTAEQADVLARAEGAQRISDASPREN